MNTPRLLGALAPLVLLQLFAAPEGLPGRALFFSEPDFRGECLIVTAGSALSDLARVRDSRGQKWDDRIASVLVEGSVQVIGFADPRFHGEKLETRRRISDFSRIRHGDTGIENWDRRLSSLKVEALMNEGNGVRIHSVREAEHIIEQAYRDVLGRAPDQEGRNHYRQRILEQGLSEEGLRQTLKSSPEFKNRNVELIVRRAYKEELGREPDRRGLEIYARTLREKGWTEGELRRDMRRSEEAREQSAREIVSRAFKDILRREADSTVMEYYVRRIKAGWTEQSVREDLRRQNPRNYAPR